MSKSAAPRRVADNEAMAVGRTIRSSARKLNLVAQMIRGKRVDRALRELTFEKRRVAGEVKRVLMAAVANAENNHNLDVDQLVVVRATVGRTFVMHRFKARARGRSAGIEKPFSQITVVVREEKPVAKVRKIKSSKDAGAGKIAGVKKAGAKSKTKAAASSAGQEA